MGRFLKHELSGWKAWEIIWLAAACTVITALSLHWGDDALGITMALTGVLCVILTGKGKMSCYLFGLVNTVLYAWMCSSLNMRKYTGSRKGRSLSMTG